MLRAMRAACLGLVTIGVLAGVPVVAATKKAPKHEMTPAEQDANEATLINVFLSASQGSCSEDDKFNKSALGFSEHAAELSSYLLEIHTSLGNTYALEYRTRDATDYNMIAQHFLDKGCHAVSRKIYLRVIEAFTGSSYAAARQRAQIGIDDVRAAMAAPKAETPPAPPPPTPAPNPAAAEPAPPPAKLAP